MAHERIVHSLARRADQSASLAALGFLPLTFQRTLMPRATVDQALVTGLTLATNRAVVSLLQESIQVGAVLALGGSQRAESNPERWSRATLALDLVGIAAGIAIQRALAQRRGEHLPRASMRTSGYWLTLAGTSGTIIGALQEIRARRTLGPKSPYTVIVPAAGALAAFGEYRRRTATRLDGDLPPDDSKVTTAKALGLGVGIAGGMSLVSAAERGLATTLARAAARVLPGREAVWRPVGHALALAGLAGVVRLVAHRGLTGMEKKEESIETAFDIPPPNPLVSGSFESHVSFDTTSKQGRRFAWTVTAEDTIRSVMHEEPSASPIRVYVGLQSAPSEAERVALVLDELDRTDAFSRAWLMVASPTGTGYVNYAAAASLELLTRGDCATVAMQYSARPSVLSLDHVNEGRAQARMLLDALHQRIAARPEGQRPKLVLFGESLGAWTSQDPFVDRGTQGLVDTGIDHAIWIGTPHFSKWKEQVLHDDRADVDPSIVHVCSTIDEWRALGERERAAIRYVMITHHDDGVALFGPELAIQAPDWLGAPADRPSHVPKSMRWMPSVAFFQVLVDMKNSATVVPGQFDAKGHDYRADLVPFFHETLGLAASDEQIERVEEYLEFEELRRSRWIQEHGGTGKSLSAAVLERLLDEQRAQGRDPNARLVEIVRELAAESLGAGGGASEPAAPAPGSRRS
jgi:uncharacterized membrane protein